MYLSDLVPLLLSSPAQASTLVVVRSFGFPSFAAAAATTSSLPTCLYFLLFHVSFPWLLSPSFLVTAPPPSHSPWCRVSTAGSFSPAPRRLSLAGARHGAPAGTAPHVAPPRSRTRAPAIMPCLTAAGDWPGEENKITAVLLRLWRPPALNGIFFLFSCVCVCVCVCVCAFA